MDEQAIRADERERVAKEVLDYVGQAYDARRKSALAAQAFESAMTDARYVFSRPAPHEPLDMVHTEAWGVQWRAAIDCIIARVNENTRAIEALEKR